MKFHISTTIYSHKLKNNEITIKHDISINTYTLSSILVYGKTFAKHIAREAQLKTYKGINQDTNSQISRISHSKQNLG